MGNFGIEISKNWNREERLETEILAKILDEIMGIPSNSTECLVSILIGSLQ